MSVTVASALRSLFTKCADGASWEKCSSAFTSYVATVTTEAAARDCPAEELFVVLQAAGQWQAALRAHALVAGHRRMANVRASPKYQRALLLALTHEGAPAGGDQWSAAVELLRASPSLLEDNDPAVVTAVHSLVPPAAAEHRQAANDDDADVDDGDTAEAEWLAVEERLGDNGRAASGATDTPLATETNELVTTSVLSAVELRSEVLQAGLVSLVGSVAPLPSLATLCGQLAALSVMELRVLLDDTQVAEAVRARPLHLLSAWLEAFVESGRLAEGASLIDRVDSSHELLQHLPPEGVRAAVTCVAAARGVEAGVAALLSVPPHRIGLDERRVIVLSLVDSASLRLTAAEAVAIASAATRLRVAAYLPNEHLVAITAAVANADDSSSSSRAANCRAAALQQLLRGLGARFVTDVLRRVAVRADVWSALVRALAQDLSGSTAGRGAAAADLGHLFSATEERKRLKGLATTIERAVIGASGDADGAAIAMLLRHLDAFRQQEASGPSPPQPPSRDAAAILLNVKPLPWRTALSFLFSANPAAAASGGHEEPASVRQLRAATLSTLARCGVDRWAQALWLSAAMRDADASHPMLSSGPQREKQNARVGGAANDAFAAARISALEHLRPALRLAPGPRASSAPTNKAQHAGGASGAVARAFDEMDLHAASGKWATAAAVFMENRNRFSNVSELVPITPAVERVPAVAAAALRVLVTAEKACVQRAARQHQQDTKKAASDATAAGASVSPTLATQAAVDAAVHALRLTHVPLLKVALGSGDQAIVAAALDLLPTPCSLDTLRALAHIIRGGLVKRSGTKADSARRATAALVLASHLRLRPAEEHALVAEVRQAAEAAAMEPCALASSSAADQLAAAVGTATELGHPFPAFEAAHAVAAFDHRAWVREAPADTVVLLDDSRQRNSKASKDRQRAPPAWSAVVVRRVADWLRLFQNPSEHALIVRSIRNVRTLVHVLFRHTLDRAGAEVEATLSPLGAAFLDTYARAKHANLALDPAGGFLHELNVLRAQTQQVTLALEVLLAPAMKATPHPHAPPSPSLQLDAVEAGEAARAFTAWCCADDLGLAVTGGSHLLCGHATSRSATAAAFEHACFSIGFGTDSDASTPQGGHAVSSVAPPRVYAAVVATVLPHLITGLLWRKEQQANAIDRLDRTSRLVAHAAAQLRLSMPAEAAAAAAAPSVAPPAPRLNLAAMRGMATEDAAVSTLDVVHELLVAACSLIDAAQRVGGIPTVACVEIFVAVAEVVRTVEGAGVASRAAPAMATLALLSCAASIEQLQAIRGNPDARAGFDALIHTATDGQRSATAFSMSLDGVRGARTAVEDLFARITGAEGERYAFVRSAAALTEGRQFERCEVAGFAMGAMLSHALGVFACGSDDAGAWGRAGNLLASAMDVLPSRMLGGLFRSLLPTFTDAPARSPPIPVAVAGRMLGSASTDESFAADTWAYVRARYACRGAGPQGAVITCEELDTLVKQAAQNPRAACMRSAMDALAACANEDVSQTRAFILRTFSPEFSSGRNALAQLFARATRNRELLDVQHALPEAAEEARLQRHGKEPHLKQLLHRVFPTSEAHEDLEAVLARQRRRAHALRRIESDAPRGTPLTAIGAEQLSGRQPNAFAAERPLQTVYRLTLATTDFEEDVQSTVREGHTMMIKQPLLDNDDMPASQRLATLSVSPFELYSNMPRHWEAALSVAAADPSTRWRTVNALLRTHPHAVPLAILMQAAFPRRSQTAVSMAAHLCGSYLASRAPATPAGLLMKHRLGTAVSAIEAEQRALGSAGGGGFQETPQTDDALFAAFAQRSANGVPPRAVDVRSLVQAKLLSVSHIVKGGEPAFFDAIRLARAGPPAAQDGRMLVHFVDFLKARQQKGGEAPTAEELAAITALVAAWGVEVPLSLHKGTDKPDAGTNDDGGEEEISSNNDGGTGAAAGTFDDVFSGRRATLAVMNLLADVILSSAATSSNADAGFRKLAEGELAALFARAATELTMRLPATFNGANESAVLTVVKRRLGADGWCSSRPKHTTTTRNNTDDGTRELAAVVSGGVIAGVHGAWLIRQIRETHASPASGNAAADASLLVRQVPPGIAPSSGQPDADHGTAALRRHWGLHLAACGVEPARITNVCGFEGLCAGVASMPAAVAVQQARSVISAPEVPPLLRRTALSNAILAFCRLDTGPTRGRAATEFRNGKAIIELVQGAAFNNTLPNADACEAFIHFVCAPKRRKFDAAVDLLRWRRDLGYPANARILAAAIHGLLPTLPHQPHVPEEDTLPAAYGALIGLLQEEVAARGYGGFVELTEPLRDRMIACFGPQVFQMLFRQLWRGGSMQTATQVVPGVGPFLPHPFNGTFPKTNRWVPVHDGDLTVFTRTVDTRTLLKFLTGAKRRAERHEQELSKVARDMGLTPLHRTMRTLRRLLEDSFLASQPLHGLEVTRVLQRLVVFQAPREALGFFCDVSSFTSFTAPMLDAAVIALAEGINLEHFSLNPIDPTLRWQSTFVAHAVCHACLPLSPAGVAALLSVCRLGSFARVVRLRIPWLLERLTPAERSISLALFAQMERAHDPRRGALLNLIGTTAAVVAAAPGEHAHAFRQAQTNLELVSFLNAYYSVPTEMDGRTPISSMSAITCGAKVRGTLSRVMVAKFAESIAAALRHPAIGFDEAVKLFGQWVRVCRGAAQSAAIGRDTLALGDGAFDVTEDDIVAYITNAAVGFVNAAFQEQRRLHRKQTQRGGTAVADAHSTSHPLARAHSLLINVGRISFERDFKRCPDLAEAYGKLLAATGDGEQLGRLLRMFNRDPTTVSTATAISRGAVLAMTHGHITRLPGGQLSGRFYALPDVASQIASEVALECAVAAVPGRQPRTPNNNSSDGNADGAERSSGDTDAAKRHRELALRCRGLVYYAMGDLAGVNKEANSADAAAATATTTTNTRDRGTSHPQPLLPSAGLLARALCVPHGIGHMDDRVAAILRDLAVAGRVSDVLRIRDAVAATPAPSGKVRLADAPLTCEFVRRVAERYLAGASGGSADDSPSEVPSVAEIASPAYRFGPAIVAVEGAVLTRRTIAAVEALEDRRDPDRAVAILSTAPRAAGQMGAVVTRFLDTPSYVPVAHAFVRAADAVADLWAIPFAMEARVPLMKNILARRRAPNVRADACARHLLVLLRAAMGGRQPTAAADDADLSGAAAAERQGHAKAAMAILREESQVILAAVTLIGAIPREALRAGTAVHKLGPRNVMATLLDAGVPSRVPEALLTLAATVRAGPVLDALRSFAPTPPEGAATAEAEAAVVVHPDTVTGVAELAQIERRFPTFRELCAVASSAACGAPSGAEGTASAAPQLPFLATASWRTAAAFACRWLTLDDPTTPIPAASVDRLFDAIPAHEHPGEAVRLAELVAHHRRSKDWLASPAIQARVVTALATHRAVAGAPRGTMTMSYDLVSTFVHAGVPQTAMTAAMLLHLMSREPVPSTEVHLAERCSDALKLAGWEPGPTGLAALATVLQHVHRRKRACPWSHALHELRTQLAGAGIAESPAVFRGRGLAALLSIASISGTVAAPRDVLMYAAFVHSSSSAAAGASEPASVAWAAERVVRESVVKAAKAATVGGGAADWQTAMNIIIAPLTSPSAADAFARKNTTTTTTTAAAAAKPTVSWDSDGGAVAEELEASFALATPTLADSRALRLYASTASADAAAGLLAALNKRCTATPEMSRWTTFATDEVCRGRAWPAAFFDAVLRAHEGEEDAPPLPLLSALAGRPQPAFADPLAAAQRRCIAQLLKRYAENPGPAAALHEPESMPSAAVERLASSAAAELPPAELLATLVALAQSPWPSAAAVITAVFDTEDGQRALDAASASDSLPQLLAAVAKGPQAAETLPGIISRVDGFTRCFDEAISAIESVVAASDGADDCDRGAAIAEALPTTGPARLALTMLRGHLMPASGDGDRASDKWQTALKLMASLAAQEESVVSAGVLRAVAVVAADTLKAHGVWATVEPLLAKITNADR